MENIEQNAMLKCFVSHKKGFAFKSSQYRVHGHPIVKVSNFYGDSIDASALVCIGHDEVGAYSSVKLRANDVVIATVGSWAANPASVVGRVVRVPNELEGALLNQNSVILRADSGMNQRFLFYLLKDASFKEYIIGTAQGSANQASIKLNDIFGYQFYLPPLKTQQAIAHILGTLDDKIELNRRMNETLEAMAQALFKSWFIDFDGCTEFEESELGLIPKGWHPGMLVDLALNVRTSIKPNDLSTIVPYFGLEHLPRKSIALDRWEYSDKITSNKYAFKKGDFLFGKLRPYFHKVGIAPIDGICSTDILAIRPKKDVFYSYVIALISSTNFVDYTELLSNGAKMPRTNWKDMGKYEVVVPKEALVEKFNLIAKSLFAKIQNNIFQMKYLTNTRDTLLPKLISGEIKVGDAEKMVGKI